MKKQLLLIVLLSINLMAFGQRICGSIYNQEYLNSLTPQQKIKLDNFNNKLEVKEKNELKGIPQ